MKIYSTALSNTSLNKIGSGSGSMSGIQKKNRLNALTQNQKKNEKEILSKSIDSFHSKYKNY